MDKEKIELYSEKEFEKPEVERKYYLKEFKKYKKDKNLSEDEARLMAFYKCGTFDFFHLYTNNATGKDFGPRYKSVEYDSVWFTNKEVAEMMGMEESKIIKMKKKLKDLSYIKVQGQKIWEIK